MTDQITKDVEHLKAQMDGMRSGQDDIKESIKEIAHALNELLSLRKAHDIHDIEIGRLREASHKHANLIQVYESKLIFLDRLSDRLDRIEKIETDMRINMAKNSVISSIVTTMIIGFMMFAMKQLGA